MTKKRERKFPLSTFNLSSHINLSSGKRTGGNACVWFGDVMECICEKDDQHD